MRIRAHECENLGEEFLVWYHSLGRAGNVIPALVSRATPTRAMLFQLTCSARRSPRTHHGLQDSRSLRSFRFRRKAPASTCHATNPRHQPTPRAARSSPQAFLELEEFGAEDGVEFFAGDGAGAAGAFEEELLAAGGPFGPGAADEEIAFFAGAVGEHGGFAHFDFVEGEAHAEDDFVCESPFELVEVGFDVGPEFEAGGAAVALAEVGRADAGTVAPDGAAEGGGVEEWAEEFAALAEGFGAEFARQLLSFGGGEKTEGEHEAGARGDLDSQGGAGFEHGAEAEIGNKREIGAALQGAVEGAGVTSEAGRGDHGARIAGGEGFFDGQREACAEPVRIEFGKERSAHE